MLEILNLCAQVEETIAHVYRSLASGTENNPELKRIWAKMAIEEDGHADTIRFALRMNPLEHINHAAIDKAEVKCLLDEARKFLDLVRNNNCSELEALNLATSLEGEFKRVHIQMAAEFKKGPMKEMFDNLGQRDQEHLFELEKYRSRH